MLLSKQKILAQIVDSGLVAVVRAENSDQACRIADACSEGGVGAIEITFTVPGAAAVIAELARRDTSRNILIGAGTVLDPETADFKVSAQMFLDRADAVLLHSVENSKTPAWERVSLKPVMDRPTFEIHPPEYVTPEVVEFVRARLSRLSPTSHHDNSLSS